MKVVIAHRSGQPKVVELPEPKAGKNFVTVRVSHSAMSLPGELDLIDQAPRRTRKGDDGLPLGGCASGTVIEVGSGVKSIKEGVRVAVSGAPYVYHAGQLVVPESLVVELPKKVNHEEGSFAGQGAAAMHLMRTARVQLGEVVLIYGGDLPGLIAAQLVRAAGGTPILIDESEFRLNKMHTIGVTHTFVPGDEEIVRTIDVLTDGHGADAALLTRPNDIAGYTNATELLRLGGILVLGAKLGQSIPVDRIREKSIELLSAVGGGPGHGDREYELRGPTAPRSAVRWTERDNMACFCQLLSERKVQISPLVTDRVPLERAATIYEKATRSRDAVLGAVLTI